MIEGSIFSLFFSSCYSYRRRATATKRPAPCRSFSVTRTPANTCPAGRTTMLCHRKYLRIGGGSTSNVSSVARIPDKHPKSKSIKLISIPPQPINNPPNSKPQISFLFRTFRTNQVHDVTSLISIKVLPMNYGRRIPPLYPLD